MEIFISLFFFLVYSIFILCFGKYGLTQSSKLLTFFVANKSLELWPSIFTFCATWISMTSLLAITGAFYLEGITPLFTVILGWILGASLLLLTVKRLREYVRKVPKCSILKRAFFFFYEIGELAQLKVWHKCCGGEPINKEPSLHSV